MIGCIDFLFRRTSNVFHIWVRSTLLKSYSRFSFLIDVRMLIQEIHGLSLLSSL